MTEIAVIVSYDVTIGISRAPWWRATRPPLTVTVPNRSLNRKALSGTASAPVSLVLKVEKSHVHAVSPASLLFKTRSQQGSYYCLAFTSFTRSSTAILAV